MRRMISDGICFRCSYYLNLLRRKDEKRVTLIIDGHIQQIVKTDFLIAGSAIHRWPIINTFKYIITCEGNYFRTNNLHDRGEIPQAIKNHYPSLVSDNALFIDEVTYEELRQAEYSTEEVKNLYNYLHK